MRLFKVQGQPHRINRTPKLPPEQAILREQALRARRRREREIEDSWKLEPATPPEPAPKKKGWVDVLAWTPKSSPDIFIA